MDIQSLQNVLDLLRLISTQKKGTAPYSIIQSWMGDINNHGAILQLAGNLWEQARIAERVVQNSQLRGEAQAGVIKAIQCVKNAFTTNNLFSAWNQSIPDAAVAISSLAMLIDFASVISTRDEPEDVSALIEEIRELIKAFDDPAIDPGVRDVAQRHLHVLSTLLEHIPIFGLEAAMLTYFELLMRMRRADIDTTPESQAAVKTLWEKIEGWGTRLNTIDKIWNSGARLLEHADKAQGLLTYLPNLPL